MKFEKEIIVLVTTLSIGLLATFFPSQHEQKIVTESPIENESPKVISEPTPPPTDKKKESAEKIYGIDDEKVFDSPAYSFELFDITETSNSFIKDDIETGTSGKWLGLFEGKSGFKLEWTNLKVVPENRESFAENTLTTKLDKQETPVFLLRNAKKLKVGKINTLLRNSFNMSETTNYEDEPSMQLGYEKKIEIEDSKYKFMVKEGLTISNKKVLVLVLQNGDIEQQIHHVYNSDGGEYVGELLWVGDLDNDKKLDFYMSFYGYEKGGFGSALFLSSEAEKGKLVREVAGFGTSGC